MPAEIPPLTAHELLAKAGALAARADAPEGDPHLLDAEIRRLIFQARLMDVNYELTVLRSRLFVAESLLLLRRPAEALAVIHAIVRHFASRRN